MNDLCVGRMLLAIAVSVAFPFGLSSADEPWRVGFGKVDVTPSEPLRLSGYATRVASHAGVADSLAVRAMVVSPPDTTLDAQSVVLVSIDSIAVSSAMTVEVANWLYAQHSLSRSQLVLCSTHSHAAPHVDGALQNLFRELSTAEQVAATKRYTDSMIAAIETAIDQAFSTRMPATLSLATAQAQFAVNRRVLNDAGVWTGFGEQPGAPTDHRVRMMIAHRTDGGLLGGAYLYACHCTTLGGDFNQISGDWAGLSASRLEQRHAQTVFLPIIGCGADANPNPRGTYEGAQQHAAEMVTAVESLLSPEQTLQSPPLADFPVAHFGYAGLASEHPTAAALEAALKSEQPNEKRWAEHMVKTKKEMGRLPETYPMPIHTWQFGDELSWVFLGGEVVVDYQLQIEKELPTKQTWVAAYTDDVFAYVASERMRSEGGYEVDFSMLYYLQPGRWQSGTQSLIVRRVMEILAESHSDEKPLTSAQALNSARVPDDYVVELVAAEPLVQDPINIAFGMDGRVWVVEMADYPLGVAGGGRVKWLRDTDADGKLDEAHVFLDGLSYPTSVLPWKKGVLVIAAPDILFAEDVDGDGKADRSEPFLTGIDQANPQHRASGFEIGLDGWLHFGVGHGTKILKSLRNGLSYSVDGRDVAWNPETGELKTMSGETQFVRSRDAFGNWFGNSNSRPMYQFVIEDRYLHQGSVTGGPRQDLLTPAIAPPVYPRSRTLDRFNDLYAFNRFTSACSSIAVRVPGLGADDRTALVCEPVHNLVARFEISQQGSCLTATHTPDATGFDFFTSTDAWSRPVRVVNAPDGTVWVVDMVRRVIEHPEWIPTAWQERLDVRSGSELGRIYRIAQRNYRPLKLSAWDHQPTTLIPMLASENGVMRDMALQAITYGDVNSMRGLESDVRRLTREHATPAVRASALGCLAAKRWLNSSDIVSALADRDARVVRLALELSEQLPLLSRELVAAMVELSRSDAGSQVDLQWALTANLRPEAEFAEGVANIAMRWPNDGWLLKALSLLQDERQAIAVTRSLLGLWSHGAQPAPQNFTGVQQCLQKLWQRCPIPERDTLAIEILNSPAGSITASQLLLLGTISQNNSKSDNVELETLLGKTSARILQLVQAGQLSDAEKLPLINLLGGGLTTPENELQIARSFLKPDNSSEVRRLTIETLQRLRSPQVAEELLSRWKEFDGGLRMAAGATLLSRREWASELVAALENGSVDRHELDLATLQQLSTYSDRELRYRCIELFGKPTERSAVVAEYLRTLPTPTETPQGEKLFVENCAACHRAKDGRLQLGPPLENLKHWTLDQWITAIMDPNQAVEPKYRQSTLITEDGQALTGLVLDRSPRELLLGVSDGSTKSIAVASVVGEKNAGVSLMPVGFEQKLTPQQLSEVIAFLRSR